MFGAGGGTSAYQEAEETDLIILWGSNARETHPIFFHHVLKGKRRGARLYAIDPRRTSSAAFADVVEGERHVGGAAGAGGVLLPGAGLGVAAVGVAGGGETGIGPADGRRFNLGHRCFAPVVAG